MRELFLVPGDSTPTSLVFKDHESGEQYFLEVTAELKQALIPQDTTPALSTSDDEEHNEIQASGVNAESSSEEDTKEQKVNQASAKPRTLKPATEMDPRLSAPLKMRPREIQDRIRAGATITEIAAENEVTEARIEPFAHPVLLERARIAELAKKAHPVRDDGPAKLTLWEILATAFAARGIDLATTTWDAYRDLAGQWVIRVTWPAGLSEHSAEWSYMRHGMSDATAVARNNTAADLIDPDFAVPVRTLKPARRGLEVVSNQTAEPELDPQLDSTESAEHHQDVENEGATSSASNESSDTQLDGEDLMQHPTPLTDAQKSGSKRRRKAVTPHWEDVLLGVRANTKRPRN